MHRPALLCLALLLGCAAAPPVKRSVYRLESVEVFGSRRHPAGELLAVFSVPAGRDVDFDGGEAHREARQGKERLTSRFTFPSVRGSITNYEDTRTVYVVVNVVDVGDEWRLDFAPPPTGTPEDPAGLVAAWAAYEQRTGQLYLAGALPVGDGPCRAFHCGTGFGHPALAPLEERFITGVPAHFEALVEVLRTEVEKAPALRPEALRQAGPVLLEMVAMRSRPDREGALLALRALAGRDLGEDPEAWRAWAFPRPSEKE